MYPISAQEVTNRAQARWKCSPLHPYLQHSYLRTISTENLPARLAEMYDYINFAHPFREGNGRTQREFSDQLLAESGRGLAWDLIELTELHGACRAARAGNDIDPLRVMFARINDDDPAYFYNYNAP